VIGKSFRQYYFQAVRPEDRARQEIDELLVAAGWSVQFRDRFNLGASMGVAVREYPVASGPVDYLLFVGRKAVGVVEAKPLGTTLSGVAEQSARYLTGLEDRIPHFQLPLPFGYESTGSETVFRDERDPEPRSRRVFSFHQPETLLAWLQEDDTLRSRLRRMPPLGDVGLRRCQFEAITDLELSLGRDEPRALVQMATGAGKSFTAVSQVYRLIKHAGLGRVLFLVDRKNLGVQIEKEFKKYRTPDTHRLFTELYNIQRLTSNALDEEAKVVISTIQRVYAMLRGKELETEAEEHSGFESTPAGVDPSLGGRPVDVEYNPSIPPETFDLIVVDECHRSIYNVWRQVLEYFDAYIVGLTATPSKQTIGFFNKNLVSEYPYARAVADRVNVPFEVYRIRTRMTEQGSTVDAGEYVYRRDTRTREERMEALDEDFQYAGTDLDRTVVAPDQIRTVVRCFRDSLPKIFPGRTDVPKTLVFAKDDSHAEEIVKTIRREFGKGNDFCKKITYRVTGTDPETLIKDFRQAYNPRIAVSVDMIATGTDIRPLECLLFMRDVKSQIYFDQMKGRGTRVVDDAELQTVTPDAGTKTHFVIVDAVGVCETDKTDTRPLDREPSVPMDKILKNVAVGIRDDDTLSTLAARIDRMRRQISDREIEKLEEQAGRSLTEIMHGLIDASTPDSVVERARATYDTEEPDAWQVAEAREAYVVEACKPFDDWEFREALVDANRRRKEITIDTVSIDEVIGAGHDHTAYDRAQEAVKTFERFIEEHRDEISALQLFYSRPYGERHLTLAQIRELAEALQGPPVYLTPERLWDAYAALERDRVRGAGEKRLFADVVQLVRHAIGEADELRPYREDVERRYFEWLAGQERNGRTFTSEQLEWLALIRDHVAVNLDVQPEDFWSSPFRERGGVVRASAIFGGEDFKRILSEINAALAA
jgi:type I restriction enzyme, R subunit